MNAIHHHKAFAQPVGFPSGLIVDVRPKRVLPNRVAELFGAGKLQRVRFREHTWADVRV